MCVGERERKEEEKGKKKKKKTGGQKLAPVNTSMVASISNPSPSLLRLVIMANSTNGGEGRGTQLRLNVYLIYRWWPTVIIAVVNGH